jgi:acetyl esterase
MAEQLWKALVVTPEEEKLVQEIRDSGAGKRLSPEALNQFHVGMEMDFEIDTRVGKTLVHYYRPKDADDNIPLFINMQGGGFVKGRRDQDIVFCRNICSRSGCAILDVDYVPAPAMRYPGQVYACYDVMQYCAKHADELKIDPKKIAVGGHSAGGTLTAAIILMAIDQKGFIPALQILDYAGLDNKTSALERRNGDANPRIPVWKSDFYQKMYADPEDADEIYCSPGFASDEQIAQMPPTLMIYCENDMFCDEDAKMHHRLLKLGVPVYGKRFMHSNHGFTVQRKDEYEIAEKMILQALAALKSK